MTTLLFLILSLSGYSQEKESSYPHFIGQPLSFVESHPDWEILKSSTGDLDEDGQNDIALIIESKDSIPEKRCSSCYLRNNKPRIILIFLNKDGYQNVIIQNNEFIARGDEGGMATYIEPELSITNGLLNIFYQYTRSNQSYTFELLEDRMEIIGAKSNGVHSASGNFESVEYDFKEGKIITETGHISQEKLKTEIQKINIKPKSLSEFGKMYEWQVAEYKNL
ncbi:hypothetical protein FHG64_05705 [Antarcticibacterium flavum]|uniref:Uncharacterized protein n=1 Tax=Antarcticibacterium flavum TaxID=2058175 RepID=A0A5B7X2S2_9FLAO|nr:MULTISPECIES: hypothetical protein [Antarcticibacterium]MCM4161622.1 hypothetical protein [Antarcticibacterium sp. W02-3]QCY68938.1 hypothetical protein FHG64_05705 [Antarcticibacterium flavum]